MSARTPLRLSRRGGPVRQDPLRRAVALLEVDRRRVLLAALAGAGSLGSAVALAAVSAWLIARASQMPPVMHLTIAAVTVRALGISRGLLRYVERLVSHDVALRGMAGLRARLYARLADSPVERVVGLRRGDLLARVGADVDAVGDVVVRGFLPAAVAGAVGLGSVGLVGAFLPGAGAVLAGCLVLAGVVAPWWAVRAARAAEQRAAAARAEVVAVTLSLLGGADELRVARRTGPLLERLGAADREVARAVDASARAAALVAALAPLATGVAVLGALLLGVPATTAGTLAPVELAVVTLTPLAAFEAVALLPGAAVQLLRSREAAARLVALLDGAAPPPEDLPPAPAVVGGAATARGAEERDPPPGTPVLEARGLACGWPGRPVGVRGLHLDVRTGRSVAVVGPSGAGKTTLLLTLAGVLPPREGTVRVPAGDGRDARPADVHALPRARAAAVVSLTAEDAHVFDTTVLENLRVVRGDVDEAQATAALEAVGLGAWLRALPDGLATVVGAGAAHLSGGERRRLLVARALLSHAPVLLLDEPGEHLDADAGALLTSLLDGSLAPDRGVVVVTHRTEGLDAAGEVIRLAADGSVPPRGAPAAAGATRS